MSFGLRFGTLGAGSRKSSAASPPAAPTLTLTSGPSVNTPTFVLTGDLAVGDTVRFQYATASDFSNATDVTNVITAPEDAANELDFSTGPLADGAWFFRARTERPGAGNSAWSDTQSETIATVVPATTWNPADTVALALSGGNLTASIIAPPGNVGGSRSVAGHSAGKFYYENLVVSFTNAGANNLQLGLVTATWDEVSNIINTANGAIVRYDGLFGYNGANLFDGTLAFGPGDVLRVAVDMTNAKVWFAVNGGNWNGSGTDNPATNTGGLSISGFGNAFAGVYQHTDNTIVVTARFSLSGWSFTPPAGFGQF